jgi:two-component system CheB/CheR fusion protein
MSTKETTTPYMPKLETYTQIIDQLEDYAVYTLDPSYKITCWNLGATTLFGYSMEEVMGKEVTLLYIQEDIHEGLLEKEIQTALQDHKLADERWYVCKDGTKIYGSGEFFPLFDGNGTSEGFIKIVKNSTEHKKREDDYGTQVKELELLNSHKEDVLSMLSHDLRSPLDGIIGITDYMKANYETMDRPLIKEMMEHIYRAVKEEHDMLDYLIEWARIKQASETFHPSEIELNQYVEKVFDLLKETASLNTVTLFHDIEFNNTLYADGKMLLSIIQNILSNAIKHTHPGGKITVTAKKVEGKMVVQVEDNGDGMTDEIQEKLFKPQLKTLVKQRNANEGAGIGLLLVKSFLEKNGGEIWVESKAGIGSSFYFSLPLTKA